MNYVLPSLRLWLVTILVCVVGYTGLVLAFAQTFAPYQANGSIIEMNGRAVGSKLIAQEFAGPRYFWPRPIGRRLRRYGRGGEQPVANQRGPRRARCRDRRPLRRH